MIKIVKIVSSLVECGENPIIGFITLLSDDPFELECDIKKYSDSKINCYQELKVVIDAMKKANEPYNVLDLLAPYYEDSIKVTDEILINK